MRWTLGIAVALSLGTIAAAHGQRPLAADVEWTQSGFVETAGRRVVLTTCSTRCVAAVRLCGPWADVCGRSSVVDVPAPAAGRRRRAVRVDSGRGPGSLRRVRVTCWRGTVAACDALAAQSWDGVYDIDGTSHGVAAVARSSSTGAIAMRLHPEVLDDVPLRGFVAPDGVLALRGSGIVGGDVLVTAMLRLALDVTDGTTRLTGAIAYGETAPRPIVLVRPTTAGTPVGAILSLVLDAWSDGGIPLAVDVPLAAIGAGEVTTAAADVVGADGGVSAHLEPGRCLVSMSGRLRCTMPWAARDGSPSGHLWIAGSVIGDGPANQVYVGAPPAVRSGRWMLRSPAPSS